ncbi:MAG: peptidase M48 [Acidobacteria bacterium]|nr:peptidase M48 [Acidobacteriota bacterium]
MKPVALWLCLGLTLLAGQQAGTPKEAGDQRNQNQGNQKDKKDKKDNRKDPAQIGSRDVGKGINFYSLEKEIALGKQLAEEVTRQARLLDDPVTSEYVNRLGQNLVSHSDARIPFTFKVIDSEILNAFALPGGFVFVNTGLLRVAETESELAGALAHEIAHVAARHSTRQATRGQLAGYLSIPLILVGGWGGVAASQGAGVAVPMGLLKFSRVFEMEADLLGLQYVYAAGYDPAGALDLFEKLMALERRRPGALSRLFDTHPMTGDRLSRAQETIQEILPGRPEYVVSTSEFEHIRARLIAREGRAKRPQAPPSLRRPPAGAVEDAVEAEAIEAEKDDAEAETKDRPVLRRRDLVESLKPVAFGSRYNHRERE